VPIEVTESGIMTDSRLVQSRKSELPIEVTESRMVTCPLITSAQEAARTGDTAAAASTTKARSAGYLRAMIPSLHTPSAGYERRAVSR
jgi:hypothetical protein